MISAEQTTLAILAGGQGSRMGKPKSLLQIHAQPILTYLHNRFAWKGPQWLITAPGTEHPPGFESFDREFTDPEPNQGPLRGILTALEHLQSPLLVVTTVDMPAIETRQFQALADALLAQPDFSGIMFSRPSGTEDLVEPFPIALRATAREIVRSHLTSNRRSVYGLRANPAFATIPAAPDWDVWTNLNSPGDFQKFLERLPGPHTKCL